MKEMEVPRGQVWALCWWLKAGNKDGEFLLSIVGGKPVECIDELYEYVP
jgi:hypothetical protein